MVAKKNTRNLCKSDLGGVIFGCNNNTMMECLTKQLFGASSCPHPFIMQVFGTLSMYKVHLHY